jgi:dienelactone hydrolase
VTELAGWRRAPFTADGRTYDVYRRGSGPGVVVIHEIPGITPAVQRFAEDVVEAGFTVAMPSLLGTPGAPWTTGNVLRSTLKLCVSREFATWSTGRTSPVTGWLRALARDLHEQCGGPGVGALGMCFSGGFALAMMVDEHTVAPVLSQPSLPVAQLGRRHAADLNLSPSDRDAMIARARSGCPVLGLKFDKDPLPGTRFETLTTLLGDAFEGRVYPGTSSKDHSVLTEQRVPEAVERVLAFFTERLKQSQP